MCSKDPSFAPHLSTEAGISGSLCVKDLWREHLYTSAFPALFFAVLVKVVFDMIGKEGVITRLIKCRIALTA